MWPCSDNGPRSSHQSRQVILMNEPEPSQILLVFPFDKRKALKNVFWEIEEKLDRVGDCRIKKYVLNQDTGKIKGSNFFIKFVCGNHLLNGLLDGLRPTHIFIFMPGFFDTALFDDVRIRFQPDEENTFIVLQERLEHNEAKDKERKEREAEIMQLDLQLFVYARKQQYTLGDKFYRKLALLNAMILDYGKTYGTKAQEHLREMLDDARTKLVARMPCMSL